ncbi:MAG: O-antigen ligase family protein [Lachnospiraceae bacterium]|nr:O-antigen ligase family protein [Lachnospiraceae bacterium]
MHTNTSISRILLGGLLLLSVLLQRSNQLSVMYFLGILSATGFLLLIWRQSKIVLCSREMVIGPLVLLIGSIIAVISTPSHGMAILGILRLVCDGLFVLFLLQVSSEERDHVLELIPAIGCGIVITGCITFFIPALQREFFVLQRLGGHFFYANALGLYLLIGWVILVFQYREQYPKVLFYLQFVCLLCGIFWTGSRSAFMLLVPSICFIAARMTKQRIFLLLFSIAILLSFVCYVFLTGNTTSFGRFVTTSLHSGTLIERIICWRDGWTVLLANPLGLGYKGFTMMENAIQTGPYSVQFVHNDWLQIALDHGIIGFVGFTTFILMCLWKQRSMKRWLLITIGIIMFVDFNMQYESIVLVFLLLIPWETEQSPAVTVPLPRKPIGIVVATSICCLGLGWLAVADLASLTGHYKTSMAMYPWNWQVRMYDLSSDMTLETIPARAEELLKQNPWNPTAYNALSIYYDKQNNYTFAIDRAKNAVKYHRYDFANYDNLILFYGRGIESALADGNETVANKWIEQLEAIPEEIIEFRLAQDELSNSIAKDDAYQLSDLSLEILAYYKQD